MISNFTLYKYYLSDININIATKLKKMIDFFMKKKSIFLKKFWMVNSASDFNENFMEKLRCSRYYDQH